MTLALQPFEQDAEFRAAMLFFLQQAGHYMGQIFLESVPSEHKQIRLYAAIKSFDEQCYKKEKGLKTVPPEKKRPLILDHHLYDSLIPNEKGWRSPHLDVFKRDFIAILDEAIGLPQKERLAYWLRYEHAIPRDHDGFVRDLMALRKYRHYLQHPKDRREFRDQRIMEILGLYLLPSMHGQILGAMGKAERRLKGRSNWNLRGEILAADEILHQAKQQRRDETKKLYGRFLSDREKNERQNRQQRMESWNKRYWRYYPDRAWPRYRFHNFKLRMAYIGRSRLGVMEKLLRQHFAMQSGQPPENYHPHFNRDLEALFDLSLRLNRLVLEACQWMQRADEDHFKKRELRRKKLGALKYGAMQPIRNGAAHNGLLWQVMVLESQEENEYRQLSMEEVFATLFAALSLPHIPDGPDLCGQLKTKIDALLRKYDYHWVMPREIGPHNEGACKKVQRWTRKERKLYGDRNLWRIDRRHTMRHLIYQWRSAMERAYQCRNHGALALESLRKNEKN